MRSNSLLYIYFSNMGYLGWKLQYIDIVDFCTIKITPKLPKSFIISITHKTPPQYKNTTKNKHNHNLGTRLNTLTSLQ
jgi:hypothetical protein